jgi:antitoxin (DNA-binding transcriptional repressor) of toxin-antitoxin stability system
LVLQNVEWLICRHGAPSVALLPVRSRRRTSALAPMRKMPEARASLPDPLYLRLAPRTSGNTGTWC